MPVTWNLPQLGEAVAEATVDRWLKKPGDPVTKFEPLLEIMTDKVTTEITSPYDGVLARILVAAGVTARVGEPLAVFAQEGELVAEVEETATPAPPVGLFPSDTPGEMAPYSPAVRRTAAECGVDPREVAGSGAGGRVTSRDILAHVQRLRPAAAPTDPEDQLVVPTALRRAIAQRMTESVQTIPHAWMAVEADVTGLHRLRTGARADFARREGLDLTYFPFFVKAVAEALRQEPALNASWTDAGILRHERIDLNFAVATDEGLLVPLLRGADRLSVAGLASALHDLTTRARSGQLAPEDARCGTFTVNNTGALGAVLSVPIIQPGQAGIVTLEAIGPRPAVVGEGIAVRHFVTLCLSFDHRVADGREAGRFMAAVRRVMERYAPGDPLH